MQRVATAFRRFEFSRESCALALQLLDLLITSRQGGAKLVLEFRERLLGRLLRFAMARRLVLHLSVTFGHQSADPGQFRGMLARDALERLQGVSTDLIQHLTNGGVVVAKALEFDLFGLSYALEIHLGVFMNARQTLQLLLAGGK